jgi:(E)-4-hydroxy-3-methylbut-2-enyl-diphosphate synthase
MTREVMVGDVAMGGKNPIVLQSMTTPSTMDTMGTVDQIERLVDVGCQIVRVTTPSMADVENLPNIRKEMEKRKVSVPLVADVHFLPKVALKACEYVEKVRINPGNFADKKKFDVREYTDADYDNELNRVRETFLPIVKRAKELGRAMRIGTNHGSLSDRIMNRYGDSPLGMVESALEFVRIAEDEGYRDLVLSMKASNVAVMIQAYRLLVSRLTELQMDYPIHLGVTEAGDGEDGRVKSAMGIGSLLADGIGDTVRVSLTEDPEHEIPVARDLSWLYVRSINSENKPPQDEIVPWNFYEYKRRESKALASGAVVTGGANLVSVRSKLSFFQDPPVEIHVIEGEEMGLQPQALPSSNASAPIRILRFGRDLLPQRVSDLQGFDQISMKVSPAWKSAAYLESLKDYLQGRPIWFRVATPREMGSAVELLGAIGDTLQVGLEIEGRELLYLGRAVAKELAEAGIVAPIHLRLTAKEDQDESKVMLKAASEIGALLCDGIGDSVEVNTDFGPAFDHRLAFNVLQASRLRMSKTDYIACPSCGRTLFDLQETTARIRSKTSHLKGLKIAIMGCIVNGPGEMADADFGYVGSGPGHISLYVGKDCVQRAIPQAEADARLIDLIKAHGKWTNPAV